MIGGTVPGVWVEMSATPLTMDDDAGLVAIMQVGDRWEYVAMPVPHE